MLCCHGKNDMLEAQVYSQTWHLGIRGCLYNLDLSVIGHTHCTVHHFCNIREVPVSWVSDLRGLTVQWKLGGLCFFRL